jgi:PPOX class probable FMN-dependent enzyme
MSLAPWRSPLARALHRNRSDVTSRYPQLATVRPNGRPANRTVVFRDFLADSNCLLFITDGRSDKIAQLASNRQAELCWYFTKTREQFRIGGTIDIVSAEDANAEPGAIRHDLWERLSEKSKQQFVWPPPGHPRVAEGYDFVEDLDEWAPPDTFAVLIFDPDAVDHLELKGTPQNRYQYWQLDNSDWDSQAINP